MQARQLFPGIYSLGGRLATVNLSRGNKVYGEELVDIGGIEYRLWNPYRSKLAAAILNGLRSVDIKPGSCVLYLGAATGTTASHVSDIVGRDGRVYAIELSERNMRDLIAVCERRSNMLPVLADARYVSAYGDAVEQCDAIYQDVSAKDQAGILMANSRFLKGRGSAYFAIKSQSIDVSKKPDEVYKNELNKLRGTFSVREKLSLEPYDSMHLFASLVKS